MIPILDLVAQYHSIKQEIQSAIDRVLESGHFIMGPNVELFEKEVAAYLGVEHAVSLNSGTDALHLALRALNIGPGDEVITTAFSFAATTEAILIVGATPVFVDIDPQHYTIDPKQIESRITPRTKAILPVHLYGSAADMVLIEDIAQEYRLSVVEDCAQAIGGEAYGRKLGTMGAFGCFSFFPSKNLGAYGDGGLITTSDTILADRVRSLRAHGGKQKYYHEELGVNSRLDEVQAAILRVKLPHLEAWTAARRKIAAAYTHAFRDNEQIIVPSERANSRHVYHQYTIRVSDRDSVRNKLSSSGIQTMVYYPTALHMQPVNQMPGQTERFIHSETAAQQVLSLPIYPELSGSDQETVISALENITSVESAAL